MKKFVFESYLGLCFFVILIGFILSANFIPIQDIELHTTKELVVFTSEVAINYPLGQALICSAILVLVVTSLYKIVQSLRKKEAKPLLLPFIILVTAIIIGKLTISFGYLF
ncbi:hypothetical protein [Carnobacterium sp.]|uniref:hypothetical protein n=1 Tax=Carnobacterium sp. TaxID=48221 RepID=UPI0028A8D4A8|nr:hypothetical protein [Carnobacterium sp.]